MLGNPREQDVMEARVREPEAENARLHAELHGSVFHLSSTLVSKMTGFCNAGVAREQLAETGCVDALSRRGRHAVDPEPEIMREAADELASALPGLEDDVQAVLDELLEKYNRGAPEHGGGPKPTVDDEHVCLLPFIYVMGGFQQWMAPLLPGVRVSGARFSRLLDIATPIVVENWVTSYYAPRNIAWLRQHCGRHDGDNEEWDCVLLWDGVKFEIEKSHGHPRAEGHVCCQCGLQYSAVYWCYQP